MPTFRIFSFIYHMITPVSAGFWKCMCSTYKLRTNVANASTPCSMHWGMDFDIKYPIRCIGHFKFGKQLDWIDIRYIYEWSDTIESLYSGEKKPSSRICNFEHLTSYKLKYKIKKYTNPQEHHCSLVISSVFYIACEKFTHSERSSLVIQSNMISDHLSEFDASKIKINFFVPIQIYYERNS